MVNQKNAPYTLKTKANKFSSYIMRNLYLGQRNLILYIVIGGTGASLDFLIFSSLSLFFEHKLYILYHLLAYIAGTTISFILNAKYNFKKSDNLNRRLKNFYLIATIGLAFSTISLVFFISVLEINQIISKLLSLFIVFLIQFNLNKKITFA